MFVRNYYKALSAFVLGKVNDICGYYTSTSSFSIPKLTTVDGSVPTEYYSRNDISSAIVARFIIDIHFAALRYNYPSVDVSTPINTKRSSSSSIRPFEYGVFFGSGNTPATVDDYRLAGDTVTGYTVSYTYSDEYAEDGSFSKRTITYTITNNNEVPITIGEVGIFLCSSWITGYSSGKYVDMAYPYLLERTVLETPITIPAGGVGQVTYSITMNYLEP